MKTHYINPLLSRASITKKLDSASLVLANSVNLDGSVNPGTIEGMKMALDNICNFDCTMCGRNKDEAPIEMPFEDFKRITKEMKAFGVKNFGLFFDNEPFLNTDYLEKAIKHLKEELGVEYVFLTTNVSACTSKNLERVFKAGLDSLKFSFNSATKEQFAQVTNKSPHIFNIILKNIKTAWEVREKVFKEHNHICGLFASSIKFDQEQMARLQPILEEHVFPYVDEWYLLPEYQMGGGETIDRILNTGFDKPIAGNTGRLGVQRAPLPCWAVINSTHILANGDVYACCFPAPVEGQIMGNLFKNSFEEIINGEKYKTLRLAHVKKDVTNTVCEKCIAYF